MTETSVAVGLIGLKPSYPPPVVAHPARKLITKSAVRSLGNVVIDGVPFAQRLDGEHR